MYICDSGPLFIIDVLQLDESFILVGCILLRYVYVYLSNIPAILTENLLVLLIILSVHNMFRPLRAILKWNTTTSITYFEKAIDTTTDPLFYNCSLIWCKSLIIYINEFLF
jgi:hypothetical protein